MRHFCVYRMATIYIQLGETARGAAGVYCSK